MSEKYKLTYFDAYGKGEIIRILFAAAKVEFEDHRFKVEEWSTISKEMPFGTVPVLYIDGKPLCQSGAIMRYIASKYGLNGADEKQAAYAEMIVSQLDDVFSKLPWFEPDPKVKEEKTEAVWKESILPSMQKMEDYFKEKKRDFIVGQKMTYCDIVLMHVLIQAQIDCPQRITTLPTLCALRDRVKEVEGVKEYLATRKVCPA